MKSLFLFTVHTFFFGLMTMLMFVNIFEGNLGLAWGGLAAAGMNLFAASMYYQTLAERLK